MDLTIDDKENNCYAAARRMDVLLSGASFDVFALDLY
jgi:hypothetical protein